MTAYTDYLMLLSPPQPIINEIDRYKRASIKLIGGFESMQSKAHINITYQHRCKHFLAQHSLLQMERKLSTLSGIELQISGFAYFNHGATAKTIYAVITNTGHTQAWFKLLKSEMGIKVKNFVPHIAVVENIPVTAFNKLWPHFEKSDYQATFYADRLTILQKESYNEYAKWSLYKHLFFNSKTTSASR